MNLLRRIRVYHATLAILAALAYFTGEAGLIHAWLGYAVAAVIVVRLIWASTGVRQLGLERFYPVFAGLKLGNAVTHPAISRTLLLGIATTLIVVTATGIAIDGGTRGGHDDGLLGGVHEALAEVLVVLVVMHVTYLVLFKRPLARFMLFIDTPPAAKEKPPDRD